MLQSDFFFLVVDASAPAEGDSAGAVRHPHGRQGHDHGAEVVVVVVSVLRGGEPSHSVGE